MKKKKVILVLSRRKLKIKMGFKILFIFGIFGIITIILVTYMHEQIHVNIYNSYGVKSHVEYFSHFPSVVTIPDKNITYEDCPESCQYLHTMNEIVSYPLISIFLILFFGFLYLMVYFEKILYIFEELKGEKENEEEK